MIDVKNLAGVVAKKALDNSPAILTAVGAAGVVSTAALAIKATPGAVRKLEAERDLRDEVEMSSDLEPFRPITPFQTVKIVWKDYIPTALSASAAIAAVITANSVMTKRYAALATVYSLSEKAYQEYKAKTIETVGRVKEEEIREKVGREKYEKTAENSEIVWLGNGKSQFWDATSARAFMSDMETIRKAENEINFDIINGSYASLNDFWSKLGLPTTRYGDVVGWTLAEPLSISTYGMLLPDNTPAVGIDFNTDPVMNYNKLG